MNSSDICELWYLRHLFFQTYRMNITQSISCKLEELADVISTIDTKYSTATTYDECSILDWTFDRNFNYCPKCGEKINWADIWRTPIKVGRNELDVTYYSNNRNIMQVLYFPINYDVVNLSPENFWSWCLQYVDDKDKNNLISMQSDLLLWVNCDNVIVPFSMEGKRSFYL